MSSMQETAVTQSRLERDLSLLGIGPGDTLMIHCSIKSFGWLVGGPDIVIRALLEVIGPEGTLMMYTGWQDSPYTMEDMDTAQRAAYASECPPYDPATSRAVTDWSVLAEIHRKWPGAKRSAHPDGSFSAIGKHAEYLVADHPFRYGYGPGSPLAKLVDLDGKVAMLGAPLETVTLLHYSEDRAHIAGKRVVRYRLPVIGTNGRTRWVDIEEFDTNGVVDWYDGDYFGDAVREYVTAGVLVPRTVGQAVSYLFDAADLHEFAMAWMERNLNRTDPGNRK